MNTHWIETRRSFVVIDGLRRLSHTRAVVDAMRAFRKPVSAVVLTHAHPDHYGGLKAVADAYPDAGVHASAVTAETASLDPMGYVRLARQFLGDDFAPWTNFVTPLLFDNQKLVFDEITLRVHELGQGECTSATVIEVMGAPVAFVGDVVGNGFVPFLMEGRLGDWLRSLERLEEVLPPDAVIYLGHGRAGEAAGLIAAQRNALMSIRRAVSEAVAAASGWSAGARSAALARLAAEFDGLPTPAEIPDLMGLNVDAVASELIKQAATHAQKG